MPSALVHFFAANPEREAKRRRFRFFCFSCTPSSSGFSFGLSRICERHKNHVDVVVVVVVDAALRLVTLVLHLNDPPTKLYQVLCSFIPDSALRHLQRKTFYSFNCKEKQKVKDIRRGEKFAIKVLFPLMSTPPFP